MGYYHLAQICLNGHMINDCIDTAPEFNQNFCSKCGAKTITACPSCNAPLHGDYTCEEVFSFSETPVEAYCYNCGSPYPWTETVLETANAIIHEDELLTEEQMQQFYACLPDLLTDTPKTRLALIRFKKFVGKAASATSAALYDILKDIVSEAIKKQLFGN